MTDSLLQQTEQLKNILISRATGGNVDNADYIRLRRSIISNNSIKSLVPKFVSVYRDVNEFWNFIQPEYATYRERREYLRTEFSPLLDFLERGGIAPSDDSVAAALQKVDSEHVNVE